MSKTPIHIRLNDEVLNRLQRIAASEYRTISNLVEKILIEKLLDKPAIKQQPKHLNGGGHEKAKSVSPA